MTVRHSARRAMVVSVLVLLTISCASLSLTPTPQLQLPTEGALRPAMVTLHPATATLLPVMATVVPAAATLSAASGGGGGGGSGGGAGGSGGGGAGGAANQAGSTPPPTLEIPIPAPFVVKQIQTLGDEKISGAVCDLTATFNVTATTPKITFVMKFFPQGAAGGNLAYAYSMPSLGEAHDAAGSYTISVDNAAANTLLLTMKVSDHVTFKGFDGLIPINYKFDLVHSTEVRC